MSVTHPRLKITPLSCGGFGLSHESLSFLASSWYGIGPYRSWAALSRRILAGASLAGCLIETYRTSNPLYTAEELAHQLELSKTRLLFVHPAMLAVAAEAAHAVGLPYDRIVLFDSVPTSPHSNVQELIKFGLAAKQEYTERRLKPGEARTKLALLLFSSGTTGKPKVLPFFRSRPTHWTAHDLVPRRQ